MLNQLPPEPRLLIQGDVAAAAPYAGIARKLAKRAYLSGIRAKTWQVAVGVVVRVENYLESRLSKVYIRAAPAGFPFLAVTWEPEGIVLTPLTEAVPYGYGFPKRDATTGELINPPFGTEIQSIEDEALNQVLLNRFANNKYLDKIGFVSGIPTENDKPVFEFPENNPRLRNSIEVPIETKQQAHIVYWPLFYEPAHIDSEFWENDENRVEWIDTPGVNRWSAGYRFAPLKKPNRDPDGNIVGNIQYRQFSEEGESLLFEPETETWYCHWPEELLYDNLAYEVIFQETNVLRSEVGREPLIREIRGFANMSRMVLSEMQRARVQFHDNEELYRPGYGTVLLRALQSGQNFVGGAENLVSGLPSGLNQENATLAVQGWRDSAGHYANMIASAWDSPKQATSLDLFGNVSCTVTESGSPDPEEFDPAISGRSYSQFFVKYDAWLYAGTIGYKLLSFSSSRTPISHILFDNRTYFYYKGRPIYFYPAFDREENEGLSSSFIGVTLYRDDSDALNFRVLCLFFNAEGYRALCAYTHPFSSPDFLGLHSQWTLECEDVVLAQSVFSILSIASFSLDGTVGLFSATRNRKDLQAEFYFTLNSSDPIGFVADQIAIQYANRAFSIFEVTTAPTINHQVTTQEYGPIENPTQYTRVSRYHQIGSGTVTYYPFYTEDGELVYLKQHISIEADQTYDGTTDYSYFKAVHSLEFPSELTITIVNQEVEDGEPIGSCYFIVFFYLDLLQEEAIYMRIDITKVPTYAAQGSYTLYHWKSGVATEIKDYGTATIATVAFYQPELRASWTTADGPSVGYRAGGAFDLSVCRDQNESGIFYPVVTDTTTQVRWRCTSEPALYYYPGALVSGELPMCARRKLGNFTPCFSEYEGGNAYFRIGYSIGIPIVQPNVDFNTTVLARYKDRVVSQTKVVSLLNKEPSEADQTQIWANFDLESLVGMTGLTDILPLGVIR